MHLSRILLGSCVVVWFFCGARTTTSVPLSNACIKSVTDANAFQLAIVLGIMLGKEAHSSKKPTRKLNAFFLVISDTAEFYSY